MHQQSSTRHPAPRPPRPPVLGSPSPPNGNVHNTAPFKADPVLAVVKILHAAAFVPVPTTDAITAAVCTAIDLDNFAAMAVVLRHGWAAALPGKARGFNGCGLGRRTPVTASGLPSFWCRQAGGGPPAVSASPDIITHAGTRVRKQTHRSVAALPPAALCRTCTSTRTQSHTQSVPPTHLPPGCHRHYQADSGRLLPSVTTILEQTKPYGSKIALRRYQPLR